MNAPLVWHAGEGAQVCRSACGAYHVVRATRWCKQTRVTLSESFCAVWRDPEATGPVRDCAMGPPRQTMAAAQADAQHFHATGVMPPWPA